MGARLSYSQAPGLSLQKLSNRSAGLLFAAAGPLLRCGDGWTARCDLALGAASPPPRLRGALPPAAVRRPAPPLPPAFAPCGLAAGWRVTPPPALPPAAGAAELTAPLSKLSESVIALA